MRPGTDVPQQPQSPNSPPVPSPGERSSAGIPSALSEEQLRLLEILDSAQTGMTLRQLASRLARPPEGVRPLLESLVDSQLVGQLNTVIPTYVHRAA